MTNEDKRLLEALEKNKSLTEKQRLFCYHYISSLNASYAYEQAYKCKPSTARREGCRMLTKPNIQSALVELKELTQSFLPSANEILSIMGDIARADARDFVEFGTHEEIDAQTGEKRKRNHLYFRDLECVNSALIADIGLGKDGARVKMVDKMKALQFFIKYYELEQTTQVQTESDGFVKALEDISITVWHDESPPHE